MATAPRMTSSGIRAHVAAVAKPLEERLRTKWDFKTIALTAGAMVLASTGIGLVGSYVMDRWRNSHQANVKKTELAKEFRNRISAITGVAPEKVTAGHLEEAAKRDGVLRQVKKKIDNEQASADRAAAFSNTAAFAVGGFIPGVGGVAKLAMDGGAMVAGGMVSSLFDKNVLESADVLSHIDGKLRQGQGVSEHDLMLLRISQDEQWQRAFRKMHGYAFHKGTPEQQRLIMSSMPELPDLSAMAQGINARAQSGEFELAELPQLVSANARQGFAGRIASQRAAAAQQAARPQGSGSFAADVRAQQAAAVNDNPALA